MIQFSFSQPAQRVAFGILLILNLTVTALANSTDSAVSADSSRKSYADRSAFEIGASQVEITPPPGWRMSGYFFERLNTGTADPLMAKILYFRQGETEGLIAHCDLIGITQKASNQIRKYLHKELGMDSKNTWIAATHSHTGPLYGTVLRDFFHAKAVERHGKDPQEPIDYIAFLSEQIVQGARAAQASAEAARVAFVSPEIQELAFNRRFLLSDGTVRFNPGKLNPKIVRPLGPVDPSIDFLLFQNLQSHNIASLLTFAMHLDTVGGREYSADYPFYISEGLSERLGPDLVSILGTGTCGDINHIDVRHNRPQKGQVEARRIGEALTGKVTGQLQDLKPLTNPELKFGSTRFFATFHDYTSEEKEMAKAQLPLIGSPELDFLEEVTVYRIADIASRGGEGMELEVQAIQITPEHVIVGLPGEVFVDLGLEIKKRSPYQQTTVIELVNACPGYIPTAKAYKEGSYETVNTRFQSGVGEQMVEAALKLLNDMNSP